ncbi:MAG: hypothetical protein WKI46_05660 [Aquificaceae bacterium]
MDMISYRLKEQELEKITKRLQEYKNSLLLDLVVLMDDGGRLVSFAPYVDSYKPIAQRVAIIGAAVVGAVDQLEHVISSKKSMFFSGQEKNMYVHLINSKFMLASVFSHKVPLGGVKLFKERLSRELASLLDSALGRGESMLVRFEDIAL